MNMLKRWWNQWCMYHEAEMRRQGYHRMWKHRMKEVEQWGDNVGRNR